jgi:cytoskeletal protein CcmA (bactofilin family)
MFGSKKDKQQTPVTVDVVKKTSNTSSSSHSSSGLNINSLGAGTRMEGTINSDVDIRIDGELIGTLNCKGKVIIGPKGIVDGNIDCATALIEGHFKGVLKTTDLLNVTESAVIDGEVTTGKLAVHPGARFNVHCATGNPSASKSKSATDKVLSFAKS